MLVVFLFGFGAFLATWAGYSTDSNTAFFSILNSGNASGPIWIVVIVTLIAVTMNESAIDSLQNAIADTVTSLGLSVGLKISLFWARIIVVLVNIPIIVVGLQDYKIASLFLIPNMLTTFSTPLLVLGMLPQFDALLNGATVLFSFAFAFASLLVYGYLQTVHAINFFSHQLGICCNGFTNLLLPILRLRCIFDGCNQSICGIWHLDGRRLDRESGTAQQRYKESRQDRE